MDAVEKALGHYEGPWFMQEYGLVDITFVPFLERIVASIPYYKVPAYCPDLTPELATVRDRWVTVAVTAKG